ncbi:hypothetical protein CVV38_00795 [Candidatus Peregrinibacteria bacterium HGW-Peregrinibacteria-1]|nr:MAG: hypothetical protein CVV38_00795 [Candidatus Peregrinibacteria bacterium HGW-Peregrinibacteria-1]
MQTSTIVLQIVGPLFIMAGAGLLVNRGYYEKLANSISKSVLALLAIGMLAASVGLLIINTGQGWTNQQEIVTSLLGWAMFLKGLFILVVPQSMINLSKSFLKHDSALMLDGALALILGSYITYLGYFM